MISFSTIQEAIIHLGAPSTIVLLVVVGLHTGYVPFETELSKARVVALENARLLDEHAIEMKRNSEQHTAQMLAHERALDAMLTAMREICFNTAKTNERERACGALNRFSYGNVAPTTYVLQ